jgi:hypothetical protein
MGASCQQWHMGVSGKENGHRATFRVCTRRQATLIEAALVMLRSGAVDTAWRRVGWRVG